MSAEHAGQYDRRRFVAASAAIGAAFLTAGLPLTGSRRIPQVAAAQAGVSSSQVIMHRGNAARTGVMPGPGPAISDGLEVVWTFTDEFNVNGPAVVDGVAFIAGVEGILTALNAADGTTKWEFMSEAGLVVFPTVVNDLVYVADFDINSDPPYLVYAVDVMDGSERWRFETAGNARSLAVVDEVLYAGCGRRIYALNATDGVERWQVTPDDSNNSPLAVVNGVVYAGCGTQFYALNTIDGSERWRYAPTQAMEFITAPTVIDDAVYIMAGDGTLVALNSADGTERWRQKLRDFGGSSLAIEDRVVYTRGKDTNLFALNTRDGTEHWRFTADHEISSPVIADGLVYFGDTTFLYALNAVDGTEIWRFTLESDYLIEVDAVIDGMIYASVNSTLYAIGTNTPVLEAE